MKGLRLGAGVAVGLFFLATASEAAGWGRVGKLLLKQRHLVEYFVGYLGAQVTKNAPKEIMKCYEATQNEFHRRHVCRAMVDGLFGSDERSGRFKEDLERLFPREVRMRVGKPKSFWGLEESQEEGLSEVGILLRGFCVECLGDSFREFPSDKVGDRDRRIAN